MMSPDDLAWTIEEACLNAWPSPRQVLLDGWLLRASGGATRRTNSVNPLRFGPRDPAPILDQAQAIYAALGQPATFRVPSLVPEMEAALDRHGYAASGATSTLFAELADGAAASAGTIELSATPTPEWLAARAALNPASTAARPRYDAIIESLVLPALFAARRVGGEIVAVAFGVVHRRLLVLEAVATHPEHRRRGHGREIVAGLMAAARSAGAEGAALQVLIDNPAGRALYDGLGFRREVYRYHYRSRAETSR